MFKPLTGVMLLLAAMFPSVCSAEEFVLQWEHILCKEFDEKLLTELNDADTFDFENFKGTITESIELRIKTGQRFHSKVRFGKKTIELRGDLKPHNQPGDFVLNISASISTFSGSFTMQPDLKMTELPDLTSSNTTVVVTVDKPLFLSGMATLSTKSDEELRSRKPDLAWMCVTLEPANDED